MPKVVRFHELGGPEALKFEEQPTRQPEAGEVRIRVQAVGPTVPKPSTPAASTSSSHASPPASVTKPQASSKRSVPASSQALIGRAVATVPGFSINDYQCSAKRRSYPSRTSRRIRKS